MLFTAAPLPPSCSPALTLLTLLVHAEPAPAIVTMLPPTELLLNPNRPRAVLTTTPPLEMINRLFEPAPSPIFRVGNVQVEPGSVMVARAPPPPWPRLPSPL